MDHRSFRDALGFSIGFAVSCERDLLRRLLKEHAPDDARQMLAKRVIAHLELSGFVIDEAAQTMRKKRSAAGAASVAQPAPGASIRSSQDAASGPPRSRC